MNEMGNEMKMEWNESGEAIITQHRFTRDLTP